MPRAREHANPKRVCGINAIPGEGGVMRPTTETRIAVMTLLALFAILLLTL
jgi:hypothetical protein